MLAGTSWAGGEELTIDVNQIMHFPALVVWGGGKSLHVIKRGGLLMGGEEVLPISHSKTSPQAQAIPNST